MKKLTWLPLFVIFIIGLFLAGCQDRNDKYDDTDMENNDIVLNDDIGADNHFWTYDRDYTWDQRDEFRRDVNTSIDKLDMEIEKLEAKSANAADETKEWYKDRIKDLKERRADLNDDMNDFANTTQEGWEDFKSGVKNTWNDIEDSWNDMVAKIEDNVKKDDNY